MKKILLVLLLSLGLIACSEKEPELDHGNFKVTELGSDGKIETSYLNEDLSIKHGKEIFWWKNGQKGVEKNYINNVLDGKYTSWYDNGQIMGEGNYIDGEVDGKYTFWYRNGQIESISNRKDGLSHGKSINWYENGQKEKELNFKNGAFDGTYTMWFEDGQIKIKTNWKDGQKNGTQTEWHEDGQIKSATNWKDSRCISGDCPLDSEGPWVHNDKILPFESFVKEWLSGDNFDAFYKYDVGDDFRESPGKYFGKEIPSLEGIVPDWDNNKVYYISVPLDSLDYTNKTQIGHQDNLRVWSKEKTRLKNNGVYFKTTEPHFLETYYTVIGLIDKELCHELAPNIKGECVDSRIVYFEDYGGGTIGPQSAIAIFGLFQLENKKEYMVPLKYLTHKMVKKYINK